MSSYVAVHASLNKWALDGSAGVIIGLAIYNAHILDFAFAGAVYKKLLGHDVGLEDLRDVDLPVYQSLKQLLAHPADRIEQDMDLTFQVTHELDFCTEQHDLVPNGGDIVVTGANRQQFVEAYVRFLLQDRVAAQAEAFVAGFRRVCDSPVLQMFQGPELEQVVCGCGLIILALSSLVEAKGNLVKMRSFQFFSGGLD